MCAGNVAMQAAVAGPASFEGPADVEGGQPVIAKYEGPWLIIKVPPKCDGKPIKIFKMEIPLVKKVELVQEENPAGFSLRKDQPLSLFTTVHGVVKKVELMQQDQTLIAKIDRRCIWAPDQWNGLFICSPQDEGVVCPCCGFHSPRSYTPEGNVEFLR